MSNQGPVIVLEKCGCMVDHGIPYRCPKHQLHQGAVLVTPCCRYDYYEHPDGTCECKSCGAQGQKKRLVRAALRQGEAEP